MDYLKKYGLRLIYTLITIFILLVFLTTLYYFNIISSGIYRVVKIVIVLLSIFINAFLLGKEANKRGYLEGIKLGGIVILIFFFTTLFTNQELKLRVFIYYFIIGITSILGSMIGISREKEPKS